MKIAAVRLACHYQRCWQDGFGARGWKLASAVGDPEVIASTAATGERIRTSVFVHDILDHILCGLPNSGHRNEAVALVQLARRTGADPTPDFVQMVEEDLLQGRIIGESLVGFLPADLVSHLAATDQDGRAIITALQAVLGKEGLRERLIARFFELGEAGAAQAAARYAAHRLDYDQRGALGLGIGAPRVTGTRGRFRMRTGARARVRLRLADGPALRFRNRGASVLVKPNTLSAN